MNGGTGFHSQFEFDKVKMEQKNPEVCTRQVLHNVVVKDQVMSTNSTLSIEEISKPGSLNVFGSPMKSELKYDNPFLVARRGRLGRTFIHDLSSVKNEIIEDKLDKLI